jgi:hypothetical protein
VLTFKPLVTLEAPPKLDATGIPEIEKPAFDHIVHLLQHLGMHTENFYMALHLYDVCEREHNAFFQQTLREATASGKLDKSKLDMAGQVERFRVYSGWQEIATRDGAMSIYHFGRIVKATKSSLAACRTLSAKIDHENLHIAVNSVESSFPRDTAIRHVVGHAADFTQSIRARENHSVKGSFKANVGSAGIEIKKPAGGLTQFTGNSSGRSFFVTLDGKVYGYELSQATGDRLKSIRARVHASFAAATISKPAS